MTDKPTPKEIDDLVYELRQAGKDDTYSLASAVLAKWGQPSGATEEVENLRKALVYAAFALHGTPQYMLAQGLTLIDGDTVRVSRDGWTVEASVNPHRQPAPAAQQAGERVYAFRRKGLEDFCTCDEARYEELSNKPHLFETRIFYTAPQPVAREPLPKFLALKFHARRDKKATVTLLFPGHEAADAWVRGIKGGQHVE